MRAAKYTGLAGPLIALPGVLWPTNACAHLVNANVGEFYAGMLHPLTSAEHLLPTLALGLITRQASNVAAQWVLLIFPLTLMVAVILGNIYPSLQFIQTINFLGLIALGIMVLPAHRLPWLVILAMAIFIGLVLGYRSGVDMANAGVNYQFVPGVGVTGLILVVLGAAWFPRGDSPPYRVVVRSVGVGFVLAGAYLIKDTLLAETAPSVRSVGLPTLEEITALVKLPELTLPVIIGAFLGAAGWGGAHALTPGHGKAIVGAYLVGVRSTPWHAVYLGLTVTATHTLGVFMLGLVTMFASKYLVAEDLYPWLGAVSGFIVLAIGASLLVKRWKVWRAGSGRNGNQVHVQSHDPYHSGDHIHDHGHDDLHCNHHHHHGHHPYDHNNGHSHLAPGADGSPITWRSLVGLGISGGLLPCPAALVLLLAAVSLQRTGLGLALVFAFSLGLAGVLTVVGLLFVKGGQLINRMPRANAMTRFLPVLSSLAIAIIGAVVMVQSVTKICG